MELENGSENFKGGISGDFSFGSIDLTKLLNFTQFLSHFREVERETIRHFEGARAENDAEHSRQLAMLAWYINSNYQLGLNSEKLMYYSLAHDLVEIYAGDVLCFDGEARIGKEEREQQALDRIKDEIDFPVLIKYIEQYELRNNPESQFIYALDKIIAPLNIVNNDGYVWKTHGITMETLMTKGDKIKISPSVESIWKELQLLINKNNNQLFV